jgi:hypothetical protein
MENSTRFENSNCLELEQIEQAAQPLGILSADPLAKGWLV